MIRSTIIWQEMKVAIVKQIKMTIIFRPENRLTYNFDLMFNYRIMLRLIWIKSSLVGFLKDFDVGALIEGNKLNLLSKNFGVLICTIILRNIYVLLWNWILSKATNCVFDEYFCNLLITDKPYDVIYIFSFITNSI